MHLTLFELFQAFAWFDLDGLTPFYSTGGIIALGLGVEGWSVDECIGHFENLCNLAFTAREFKDIWGLNRLSAINLKYSKYKTKPFELILQGVLCDQPLFGGRQNHHRPSMRVALTATSETGEQAILLTNYNRSHKKDHLSRYLFPNFKWDAKNIWQPTTILNVPKSPNKSSVCGRREYTL